MVVIDEQRRLLRVHRGLSIPLAELSIRATSSGGPGGQHANTSNTRVEVVFDIASSPSLGPRQRALLVDRFGGQVRVVAGRRRSQLRNRDDALERLAARLHDALTQPERRVATAPTRAAKRARIEAKRRRSRTKQLRGRPEQD